MPLWSLGRWETAEGSSGWASHHTSEGEHIHLRRTRALERPGDLSKCGTSGEHVVHNQHLLVLKRRRMRDGKGVLDVLATLTAAELHLGSRRAYAHEQSLQDGGHEDSVPALWRTPSPD